MANQGQKAAGPRLERGDCPGCGSRIQGIALYCPFCGKALARTVATTGDGAPAATSAAPEQTRERTLVPPPTPATDNTVDNEADDDKPQGEAPATPLPRRNPPAPARYLVGIAVSVLIVVGAAFYTLLDSGGPPFEDRAAPETTVEPAARPAAPAPVQPEPRVRPPPRLEPGPEPLRQVVMLDERRSRQYVRPDLSSNVRVRDFPSTAESRVLASLPPGSEVMVTGRVSSGDWLRVSAGGFSEGYMSASMLTREPPVSHPAHITGLVEDMRDTATLIVDGQTILLFGVAQGTVEPYLTQMQRFIREQGNTVECRHVRIGYYRCVVRAGDLGELLLINGAGRAAPDAPQTYFDNERLAQDNGRGVWAQ